jgi:hypothetical protein
VRGNGSTYQSRVWCHLQVTLPLWVGRLPTDLTQLVLSHFIQKSTDPGAEAARPREAVAFLRTHLPQLRRLRHLAFHNLHEIADSLLQDVCAAARALPHLISLHLVRPSSHSACTMIHRMAQYKIDCADRTVIGTVVMVNC